MPGAAADAAMALAKRLRAAVEQVRLGEWEQVVATGSFGVASKCGAGWTLEELMRESDAALLVAKMEGKNRVVKFVAGDL